MSAPMSEDDAEQRIDDARAREESERRYRTLFETMAQGVLYQDQDGHITAANPAARRLMGLTMDELQGRAPLDPGWRVFREDGSPLPIEERASIRAIRTRQPVLGAVTSFFNPKFGETRWLRTDATPEVDPVDGAAIGCYSIFDDITEQVTSERRQREFMRDVLASVTGGKFRLCFTDEDLPDAPPRAAPIPLTLDVGLKPLRHATETAARAEGFADDRCFDLVTAASEAGMNAIVHAGGGEAYVDALPDHTIQIWVVDKGPGISMENLPRAALEKGFTTAGTLGHGMKMMLRAVDRIHLRTGPTGVAVVLEQSLIPESPLLLNEW